ncbi:aminotransferase [Acuticoccus mangrovi]|uniref:aminotransferase n=1 Tax=Acuticoccus mangrovi TaxID=2796142 RepID=UPI001E4EEF21|nr:aminotransferase [Acuticoccus mangrovi]
MNANSPAARDVRHVLHGYVELKAQRESLPTVITAGEGIYVKDENGTPYIEAASGMWCTSLGFGEEELVEAAAEQMRKLPYYHTVGYKSVNPAIDLAEKLAEMAPIKDARVYFALSGSEANDALVKFIRYYNNAVGRPQKKKFIARHNGYHGATVATTSLTGIPINHVAFDLPLPGFLHTTDPHYLHHAHAGETREAFAERLARELDEMIEKEGPDTVAAFMAEPITGAGGVIIPPEPYYEKVQEVLKKHDVLFLDDEVVNGIWRTGKLWGAETMGIAPDTMTVAKGLTSAYQPLSALILSDEIYRGMEKGSLGVGFFAHGQTYSGHPVSCAVALKVLEIIETRDIGGHVGRVSPTFARRLQKLGEHPLVGDVRCKGLIGAVEFVADKKTGRLFDPSGVVARRIKERAESAYKLITRNVPSGDSIAFSPPLIITESEIDEVFDRFEKAVNDVMGELAREGAIAA